MDSINYYYGYIGLWLVNNTFFGYCTLSDTENRFNNINWMNAAA